MIVEQQAANQLCAPPYQGGSLLPLDIVIGSLVPRPDLGGTHTIFTMESCEVGKKWLLKKTDTEQAQIEFLVADLFKKCGLNTPVIGYAPCQGEEGFSYMVSTYIEDASPLEVFQNKAGLPDLRIPSNLSRGTEPIVDWHTPKGERSIACLMSVLSGMLLSQQTGSLVMPDGYQKCLENENQLAVSQIMDLLTAVYISIILRHDDFVGKGLTTNPEGKVAGNILVDKEEKLWFIDFGGSGIRRGLAMAPKNDELSFSVHPELIFEDPAKIPEAFRQKYYFVFALMTAIRNLGMSTVIMQTLDVPDAIWNKVETIFSDEQINDLKMNWPESEGFDVGVMIKQQMVKANQFKEQLKVWLKTPLVQSYSDIIRNNARNLPKTN